MKKSVGKTFVKYVSLDVLGMIGMSAYILADTFFISQAEGTNGITALNLVLPLYSLIFAIGSMIGIGSATRYRIAKSRNDSDSDSYFTNAIGFVLLISIPFMLVGGFFPDRLIEIFGGKGEIVTVGIPYTRIFVLFTPYFMINYIMGAFVRNDKAPSLAMAATLLSSLFNIVMDYVLMFPFGLGMTGAALATAFSPVVGIVICSIHFFSKKNAIKIRLTRLSFKKLINSCKLGVAAFVGEMSSGVTTLVFNLLMLRIAGNVGVAAYGVVANIALVATSIFNGIAQGSQPLFSSFLGKADYKSIRKVLRFAVLTGLAAAAIIIIMTNIYSEPISAVFNSEKDLNMQKYAVQGVKLYFPGFLFAGFNIIGSGYLSATESAGWAFITSILRGFVAIILFAVILSSIFGMNGVWLSFMVSEGLTSVIMIIAIIKRRKHFENISIRTSEH